MNAKYVVLPRYLIGNKYNLYLSTITRKIKKKPLIFVFDENTSKIVIKMHFYWNFCPLQYYYEHVGCKVSVSKIIRNGEYLVLLRFIASLTIFSFFLYNIEKI